MKKEHYKPDNVILEADIIHEVLFSLTIYSRYKIVSCLGMESLQSGLFVRGIMNWRL